MAVYQGASVIRNLRPGCTDCHSEGVLPQKDDPSRCSRAGRRIRTPRFRILRLGCPFAPFRAAAHPAQNDRHRKGADGGLSGLLWSWSAWGVFWHGVI